MKKVIIGIVILFLAIFGTKKWFEIQEENATVEAEKEYRAYLESREKIGDVLDEKKFISGVSEKKRVTVVFEDERVKKQLGPQGYYFSIAQLGMTTHKDDDGRNRKFSPQVGRYGPSKMRQWQFYIRPALPGQPSETLLAYKVMNHIKEWKPYVRDVLYGLLETVKNAEKEEFKGATLGLHTIRSKTVPEKNLMFSKLNDFLRALAVYGKLNFHAKNQSAPYNHAADMMLISDMFTRESVTKDELDYASKIDLTVMNYLEYLAKQGNLNKREVKKLQNKLLNIDLSESILAGVKIARIQNTGPIESKLQSLTKREVSSLNIFDSGFVLTKRERWEILLIYAKAGALLNYDPATKKARKKFSLTELKQFASFVNSQKSDLNLNKYANQVYIDTMKQLEKAVFVVLSKQVRRHEAALKLAISLYHDRTKRYPESLDKLGKEDIPYIPKNPLTGEAYKFKHVFYSKEQLKKNARLKNNFPIVDFAFKPKSFIK